MLGRETGSTSVTYACDFTGAMMMIGFTDAALQVCNTTKTLPQRGIKGLGPLDSHLQFSH